MDDPPPKEDPQNSSCKLNQKETKGPEKNHFDKNQLAWTLTGLAIAVTALCIAARVLVRACTKCRNSERSSENHHHIISNPQAVDDDISENIYEAIDTIDYAADRAHTPNK